MFSFGAVMCMGVTTCAYIFTLFTVFFLFNEVFSLCFSSNRHCVFIIFFCFTTFQMKHREMVPGNGLKNLQHIFLKLLILYGICGVVMDFFLVLEIFLVRCLNCSYHFVALLVLLLFKFVVIKLLLLVEVCSNVQIPESNISQAAEELVFSFPLFLFSVLIHQCIDLSVYPLSEIAILGNAHKCLMRGNVYI